MPPRGITLFIRFSAPRTPLFVEARTGCQRAGRKTRCLGSHKICSGGSCMKSRPKRMAFVVETISPPGSRSSGESHQNP